MNVCVLNDHACVAGGSSEVAIRDAVLLKSRFENVHFIGAVGIPDQRLVEAGVVCISLNGREVKDVRRVWGLISNLWSIPNERFVRSYLKKNQIDLVHVHSFTKALTPSIFRAARAARVPCVITVHDYFPGCPNGGLFDYRRSEICGRRGLSFGCITTDCDRVSKSQKVFRLLRFAVLRFSQVLKKVDGVLFLSSLSQKEVGWAFGSVRRYRITNPAGFEQKPMVNPVENDSFMYVGQFNTEKGPVLAASATAIAQVPFVLAGGGKLEPLIRKTNPAARLLGWLGKDELLDALSSARCLVFPSQWHEVQPLTPLEAMALGIPVVVSGRCAAREYVEHGVNGLIVESSKPDDWAKVLLSLLDDSLVQRLGRGGYEWFWSKWPSDKAHVCDLVTIYDDVVRRRSYAMCNLSSPAL